MYLSVVQLVHYTRLPTRCATLIQSFENHESKCIHIQVHTYVYPTYVRTLLSSHRMVSQNQPSQVCDISSRHEGSSATHGLILSKHGFNPSLVLSCSLRNSNNTDTGTALFVSSIQTTLPNSAVVKMSSNLLVLTLVAATTSEYLHLRRGEL